MTSELTIDFFSITDAVSTNISIGNIAIIRLEEVTAKQRFWVGRITNIHHDNVSLQWFDARREFGIYNEHEWIGDVPFSSVILHFDCLTSRQQIPNEFKAIILSKL